MQPTTLPWLCLVCITVSVCQASGRYGEADKRSMDTLSAVEKRSQSSVCSDPAIYAGEMHCHENKMCYCVGRGYHDNECRAQQRCCTQSSRICSSRRKEVSRGCRPDWFYKFGRCFRFFAPSELNGTRIDTWTQANRVCNRKGGALIAPKTGMENIFAVQEMGRLLWHDYGESVRHASVFIGLRHSESDHPQGGPDPQEGEYGLLRGWRYTNTIEKNLNGDLLIDIGDRTGYGGAWQTEINGVPTPRRVDRFPQATLMIVGLSGDSADGSWHQIMADDRVTISREEPRVLGCETKPRRS